jgi:hypothetical protein
MRLLHLAAVAAVLATALAIEARPANALQSCRCTAILPSGFCTDWICEPVLMSVPSFTPVRSMKDCRGQQRLLCDYNSCKLVCPSVQPTLR